MAGVVDRSPMYQAQDYPYTYQQPGRYQSVSSSSVRPYDRAPFSARTSYGSASYQEMARYGNLGMGVDAKQRKRRGNLPKETTDKLRAWFVAHLQHPYPTEDEKQDLMRQTGLQMNQISNWFINARRRQLPAMINSARVESDATNGRAVGSANAESKILASTERNSDYVARGGRGNARPLSDGESSAYDDDMSDGLHRRMTGDPSRESV
ncbi:homeodomain super [Purpureocillium takamizusanense]|uniref:Homeodomain super n=1 Tax=Purpureocillium takamizusanense TaxID=2060973 RepID=A0A9Q8VDB2_9HYPO|nr:homeodomain super [Purpureocillium takamizusanense]UNI21483.1 homeodomain super [Purpureocillium takamizusanense]